MQKLARHIIAGLMTVVVILAAPAPAISSTTSADELARRLATTWLGLQNRDGVFFEFLFAVDGYYGRYGNGMLGAAMLRQGIRRGDAAMQEAGLKAITRQLRAEPYFKSPSVFSHLAVADAFRMAERHLADHPDWPTHRERWAQFLAAVKSVWFSSKRPYFNKYLVEALAQLELVSTGLSSTQQQAVLANPDSARRQAIDLINRKLVAFWRKHRGTVGGRGVLILSDPPLNPLAYHAMSAAMLARVLDHLGGQASPLAWRVLGEVLNASVVLTAPDGDLAYFGRSSEQSWALALTAYAATVAAESPQLPGGWRATYRALAQRAIQRLATYPIGRWGMWIVPSMGEDAEKARQALDGYASMVAYNGLTLIALEWMLQRQPKELRAGKLPGDRNGAWRLPAGHSDFAVVRSKNLWVAVKRRASTVKDRRYDFGPAVLKHRTSSGWVDALPLREKTTPGYRPFGPALHLHGRTGYAFGERVSVRGRNTVMVRGGFRTRTGRWLRRGITFRYRLERCALRLSFAARRDDRYTYAELLGGPVVRQVAGAGDRLLTLTLNQPVRVTVRRGRASADRARTTRAVLRFVSKRNRQVQVVYRVRGCR